MAERSAGEVRAEVIARMRLAFREGMSASTFITDMRSINELESKKELFKYVRKDYLPTEKTIAHVEWEMSQEYMYKVKVHSRISPGEPMTERFVNIMSDRPLTPREVEGMVFENWVTYEKYKQELIEDVVPTTVVRRVI